MIKEKDWLHEFSNKYKVNQETFNRLVQVVDSLVDGSATWWNPGRRVFIRRMATASRLTALVRRNKLAPVDLDSLLRSLSQILSTKDLDIWNLVKSLKGFKEDDLYLLKKEQLN